MDKRINFRVCSIVQVLMGFRQVAERKGPRNGWTNHIVGTRASVAVAANQWVEEIKVSP